MIGSEGVTRLVRYAALGVLSNGFCYAIFLVLLWVDVSAVVANALCYVLGLTISYVGNRRWAFRSTNRHQVDLVRFGCAYGIGLVCSVSAMAILIRFMPAPVAQIVTIGVTAVAIFTALNLLGFGRSDRRYAAPESAS